MPQVASDPIVTRPQRPESLGRAAASSAPSGAFGDMLDDVPPAQSAPAPQRTDRAKPSDRSDQTRADDGAASQTGTPPSRDAAQPANATSEQTKPATDKATQKTKQPETDGGDASDSNVATSETPVTADASPAAALEFAAIAKTADADAPVTKDGAKVEKWEKTGKTADAKTTEDTKTDDSGDADLALAGTKSTEVTAAAIAAVPPAPTPVDAPAKPAADTAVAALGASPPAVPADAAPPQAQEPSAEIAVVPAADDASNANPAKPQKADGPAPEEIANAIVADAAPKALLKATSAAAPAEAKPSDRPERKAETGKVKSAPADDAKTAKAPSDSDESQTVPADAEAKTPAPHQPHATAEHALNARTGTADAANDTPVSRAPATQGDTAAPAPSINLAAPATSSSAAPIALRVDNAADNPVPVAGLAVEIASRAQDGAKRFDIRLDPPELGRIDVRLDVDTNGKVTSRLTVERADTLDLLRRDAPQLERALQHAGLNTEGGLQFSLRDQSFAQRDQTPRDAAPTQLIVPDDEAVAAEAARRGYGRLIGLGSGVDIRV